MSHIDKKPLDITVSVTVMGEQVPSFVEQGGGAAHGETGYTNIRRGRGRPPGSLNVTPAQGRRPKPTPALETEHVIGTRWYIAQTFGQAEGPVVRDMARQGWRGYLPLTAVWQRDRITPTVVRKVLVPLFPGFVFVEFDRDGATWGTIREYCHGVRDILRGAGGRPCPVPMGEVERLIGDDARRLQIEPASVRNEPRLPGCLIRVKVGALSGLHGAVIECDGLRTRVSVQMFGQEMPVVMAWGDVDCV